MRSSIRFLGENLRRGIVHFNSDQSVGKTIYLTHVKWVTGKHQLHSYFSRYGQVRSVNMFFDADTGLHRGFASVTFEHTESATKAMQHRPHVIDGDRVISFVPRPSKNVKDILGLDETNT
ncbi:unnamed protein product [Angiostrongylus costaricensis]|uniref:RRM domain-containing protein n=1 Tax=Angiostrongylus costaricensis TaxID=334426 RepID=A0A0R3PU12_ANGCS|nr:unnamed protein product [Angiostrongylus costaricensis]